MTSTRAAGFSPRDVTVAREVGCLRGFAQAKACGSDSRETCETRYSRDVGLDKLKVCRRGPFRLDPLAGTGARRHGPRQPPVTSENHGGGGRRRTPQPGRRQAGASRHL